MPRLSVLILLLTVGCTPHEFNILTPPDAVGHVFRKTDTVRQLDAVEYRMQAVDGGLVLRAYNNGDSPIQLLGSQSVAVDPSGQ